MWHEGVPHRVLSVHVYPYRLLTAPSVSKGEGTESQRVPENTPEQEDQPSLLLAKFIIGMSGTCSFKKEVERDCLTWC